MKSILFTLAAIGLLGLTSASAQLLSSTSAQTSFFSETPLENIVANNTKVKAVLNPANNQVAVRMEMAEFQFPNKLMQEHFNENYIESEKFPTASFQGTINEKIDWSKPGTYPVTAKGTLDIHGVKQPRTLTGTLTIEASRILLTTDFTVQPAAHHIQIPTLMIVKIAEQIKVTNKVEFNRKS
ncbi:YceI family protein [Larkinella soli]|uniref:YceI family protein n=1 Tax=Larkinella soli TaxID=1770527 RepID=UPI000FFC3C63|nr:YceI family protein [Larkinella soli]